jgi:Na+/glutamate symporter
MYVLALIVLVIYRAIMKRVAKNTPRGSAKNIGKSDRLLRVAIGIALLLWAITTSWNPLIIFFSGFALFEALFSWCGLYAALGKNTCPL